MNELSKINKVNLNLVLNKKSGNIDDYLKELLDERSSLTSKKKWRIMMVLNS